MRGLGVVASASLAFYICFAAGYFLVLDASWAAGRELIVTLGLLACSTVCFNLLEKRWTKQDARRGVSARAWN